MSVQRKRYSVEEKTQVAIEAIQGQKTLNELAAEYSVHPSQITQWKNWKPPFVSKLLRRRLQGHDQRFSTLTRVHSLLVPILLLVYKQQEFASVGMAVAEHWTIFSSNGSGEVSNMRRCISKSISRSLMQKRG